MREKDKNQNKMNVGGRFCLKWPVIFVPPFFLHFGHISYGGLEVKMLGPTKIISIFSHYQTILKIIFSPLFSIPPISPPTKLNKINLEIFTS